MATTVNLEGLIQDYIHAHEDELIAKTPVGSKSARYFYLMLGVKSKDAIPYLESEVELGDGSQCGWNPAGSDTYGNRLIEVKPVEVNKEICQRDFRTTNLNHELRWAAGMEKLPFAEAYVGSQQAAIDEAVENALWQGIPALSIDGIIAHASAELASSNKVDLSGLSTWTEKINAMVAATPTFALKKGVDLFINTGDFMTYANEQNANCCSNIGVIDAMSEEYVLPGNSKVRLIPVDGIPAGKMVVAPRLGLVEGTDVENSENIYEFFYDRVPANFKFRVLFQFGTAIKFPDATVLGE